MNRPSLAPLLSIFELSVVAERYRQLRKWGVQHHPDGTGSGYDKHFAHATRNACNVAARDGSLTWRHILAEEVYEAFAESEYEPLRNELIQVAAVALAWVEDLDSRHPAFVRRYPLTDPDIDATVEPNEPNEPELEYA